MANLNGTDDDSRNELLVRIAVLEAELRKDREALHRQAMEYERRLSELNHAHQIQADRNADYVRRESWEGRNKEVDKMVDARAREIESRITALDNNIDNRIISVEGRLNGLDNWRSRAVGIGIGAGLAGGSLGAWLARLFGQ